MSLPTRGRNSERSLARATQNMKDTPRKRGRPHGTTRDAMQASVRIRCEAAEKARWTAQAQKQGAKLSEWLRTLANER